MAESDIFVSNDIELDVDFGEIFVIDQGVVTKVVAKKYDPTKTYIVGEYVIYSDNLYRCTTAINEPEGFDNTKWTKVLLADEVQSLNEIVPTKADKADTYTKTETNTLLSNKADKSNTYTKSEVDTALADKVDTDTLDNYYTKDNVYTKTEVNDNLALKADKADTYTKGDVNDYLALKADKSDTYTKSETDTALNAKADSDSVYDKSETYSKTEVDNKIANLPAPMIMKGTLGTGGTITDLPTASSENEGFTYKVITDGTYAGQVAKTGDVFTSAKPVGSSDYIWLYIPSGDETFTDTWRGIKVNGTEELGSAISSGEVDFIDGTNTTVTFNSTGNKIKVDVDGYTQAQIDNKLALKANSADVYNKSAVDSALALKANTADVYNKTTADEKYALKADKATTYTKTEVDDITTLIKSASGNPCTFETNLADKLVSLKAAILASGGNGSPDSPIPIVGHSELNLTRCGKNFVSNYEVNAGRIIYQDCLWIECELLPNTTYTLSLEGTNGNRFYTNGELFTNAIYKDISGRTFIEITTKSSISKSTPQQYTNGYGWRVLKNAKNQDEDNTFANVQLELGSTATAYEPYNGTPYLVQFGQTVYGGSYDANAGKVRITWGKTSYDGSSDETWSGSGHIFFTPLYALEKLTDYTGKIVCDKLTTVSRNNVMVSDYLISGYNDSGSSYPNQNWLYVRITNSIDTASDLKTWLSSNPIDVIYVLATPIEIDVSELSVDTIVGVNNIVSDCGGDVEVEYEVGDLANDVKTVIGTTKFADLSDIPNPPTTDGNYRLIVTITDGKPAYSWEEITE